MAEDPFNSYMNVQVSLLSIYLRSSALFSLLSTLSSTMFNLNAHSILYSNVFQKGELTLHRISRYQIVRSTTVCLQLQVVKRHREPHWSTNHTLLLHVHLLGFFVVVFCNSARRIIWSSLILNFLYFLTFCTVQLQDLHWPTDDWCIWELLSTDTALRLRALLNRPPHQVHCAGNQPQGNALLIFSQQVGRERKRIMSKQAQCDSSIEAGGSCWATLCSVKS